MLIAAEGFFDEARLRVGAVKDGAAGGLFGFDLLGFAEIFLDAVGDEERFVFAVRRFVEADHGAAFARGPKVLALALCVLGDDGGGSLEDHLGGAIVLLEADDLDFGEVFFEVEDVLDVCAAPAVDGLIFVADDADIAVLPGEELHELVLRSVGVLVLVDHDVAVAAVVLFASFGGGFEQADGFEEEVVEVEGVGLR